MHKVYQTTFGFSDACKPEEKGNCYSACLASLMDLSLHSVPNFHVVTSQKNIDWGTAVNAWLAERGLWTTHVLWSKEWLEYWAPQAGGYILSGKSPRGDHNHAVVAEGTKIWHDPASREYPFQTGLEASSEEFPWVVEILVPFDYSGHTRLPRAHG